MSSNPHFRQFEDLPRVGQLERLVQTLQQDLASKTRANEVSQRRIAQLEEALGRSRLSLLEEIADLKRLGREPGEYIAELGRERS